MFDAMRAVVRRIPRGQVATYGQVAALAGHPRGSRQVAWALRQFDAGLPWHRVVAANARISPNMPPESSRKQRRLLKAEGLRIDKDGFIQDADDHFHNVGVRRDIRWSEG